MLAATDPSPVGAVGDDTAVEKLKAAVGNLNKLPMLPAAATQAMAMINVPDCSMKKLAGVIEADPVLAAGILKLANSALYRVGRTISNLDFAIVRLGLRECRSLIFTVGMRSLFQDLRAGQKERCETLWRHSFLTACLCRRLNNVLGLGCQGEEFSCGLFHDLGRLLITLGIPDRAAAIDPLDFREDADVLGREREQLGVDHGYFGAWFANVNQLPAALANASLFHHAPDQTHEYETLVALVAAADHMANYVQREKQTDGYTPEDNRGWPLLSVTGDEAVRARLATLLPGYLAESLQEAEQVVGFKLA